MLHESVPEEERPDTGTDHQRAFYCLDLDICRALSSTIIPFSSQNKEAFVTAAKDVISNCQSVTQFIRVIADHCLDKHCAGELSLIVEQILTITNQLSIISR